MRWPGCALCLLIATAPGTAGATPPLEWKDEWPRFRTSEAVVTGLMLLPIAGALLVYPRPGANLHGGLLFDNALRDALVADSREARDRAARWGDVPYLGLLAFPLLVDNALVTWGMHGAGDVALEMLGMNLESFAISGAVALTLQKLGRVRPAERGCATDPDYAAKCDDPVALNQSFMSGHTAIAMTGAGLTCAHHRNLPLYGGGLPDVAICVATLAAASAGGVFRIVSDDHYASDVLLAMGLGLVSGWALPEWLHYRGGKQARGSLLPTFQPEGSTLTAVLAPELASGFVGLTLLGGY